MDLGNLLVLNKVVKIFFSLFVLESQEETTATKTQCKGFKNKYTSVLAAQVHKENGGLCNLSKRFRSVKIRLSSS